MKRGDYTPLLLNPRGECEIPGPSWVKAHDRMDEHTWNLGNLKHSAEGTTIIRNESVEPELVSVGIVEGLCLFDPAEKRLHTCAKVIQLILETNGRNAAQFVAAIARIYGVSDHLRPPAFSKTLEDALARTPDFEWRLETLLDEFLAARDRLDEATVRLCRLVGLLEPLGGIAKNSLVLHFLSIYAEEGNEFSVASVATVRCKMLRRALSLPLVPPHRDGRASL